VVVVSQVSVVRKDALVERIGALSPARVDEVLAGLRFQQRSWPTDRS
jgi:mRNA interferase MazF